MNSSTHIPELLAPAGDFEALRAAVANGANAVYFGLDHFNARYRATNFTRESLRETLDYLHQHNVRGYVALNTLIFTKELPELVTILGELVAAGVDAVIVQDWGLARLIQAVAPGLVIHGSTQMTLTEPRAIEMVRQLGVERVILARELSLDNIRDITKFTTMPVEVFVHGALCMSYSGQCLTSEALGGRSANRGQCAQACRLPYDLLVDGTQREFGELAYFLSPLDLAAPDLIAPLLEAGVVSFKIEGRLKSAHYVAATAQTYRAAIDAALEQRPFELSRTAELDLQQSFSRGFSHGFFDGVNHQQLVPARFPKARGVKVGQLIAVEGYELLVQLEDEHEVSILKPGDGVVFDEGHPDQDEQGGRLYGVEVAYSQQRVLRIRFAPGAINTAALQRGATVWRTDDPAMRRRLEQSFSRDVVVHRQTIDWQLTGEIGGAVILRGVDSQTQQRVVATWAGPLQTAQKHPISLEVVTEQLSRLGDTPYSLGQIEMTLPAGCMLPKSVLNDLRRQVVQQLLETRQQSRSQVYQPERYAELLAAIQAKPRLPTPNQIQLSVLVRNEEQFQAVLAWNSPTEAVQLDAIYCDWEDVRRYRAAVTQARDVGRTIGLATLRVMKPNEEGLLSIIGRAEPDRVLVRHLGALSYYRELRPDLPLFGDFSLNVTNPLTANWLTEQGLQRLIPSFDLNWEQLVDLVQQYDLSRLEPVIHQHIPMFHNEHCVFAALLSTGKDWRDCGRPCDRHKIELRDRVGAEFPVLADTGCRNTVFNSVAQSAMEYLPRMLNLGIKQFRIDLLREDAAQTSELLDRYARVLGGQEPARNSWRQLVVLNQLGVTRGTLNG
jgi:U32 family peptidase